MQVSYQFADELGESHWRTTPVSVEERSFAPPAKAIETSSTDTASDGVERHIGPGDVWRMDDTHGKGHRTRVVSNDDFECVIIQHG